MFRKILSIFSLICFLIVTLVPRGITASDIGGSFKSTDKKSFNIPQSLGNTYSECGVPDFIFIYDSHCQPQTQNNIYSILGFLNSNYGFDKIFIEGAGIGEITSLSYSEIDLKVRVKAFDRMLNSGYLSGVEKYSYVSGTSLYGIEDSNLYKSTLKFYREARLSRTELKRTLNSVKKLLKKDKGKFYSRDNYYFDSFMVNDTDSSDKVLKYIGSIVNYQDYPETYRFLRIRELSNISPGEVNREFNQLLSYCKSRLSVSDYSHLLNEAKNGESIDYLYKLVQRSLPEEVSSSFENLGKLSKIRQLHHDFDYSRFQDERLKLFKEIAPILFSREALEVLKLSRVVNLLEKYVELRATCKEIEELFERSSVDSLETNARVKNSLLTILNDTNLEGYYKNHLIRNKVFVDNILSSFTKGPSVVVLGGFHSEVESILRERGYTCSRIYPNSIKSDYESYDRIMEDLSKNCLADTPLILALSDVKQREFLYSWAVELRNQGFNDSEIIKIIHSWAISHPEAVIQGTEEEVEEEVHKSNPFSISGWLLKIKDFFKDFKDKLVSVFKYTYTGSNPNNLTDSEVDKMVSNIRHFPFIQLVLGFDLYSSFSMVFMQSCGYTLPFISLVMSLLSPMSFFTSGIGGFIADKVSKRKLIILSLFVHSIGILSFAFSGLSPVLLVISQIIPPIGVSLLSLSLSPFLYNSLNSLGEKDSFKEVYGSNLSLFWIVMSVSTLIGGLLVSLTNQFTVIILAALPSLFIGIVSIFKIHDPVLTHKVKVEDSGAKKGIKTRLKDLVEPVVKLSKDGKTFSLAMFNIIINNVFFVVLCFFLQPSLMSAGMDVALLAPVYFIGNLMQSLASHLVKKVCFIAENKTARAVVAAVIAGMFGLFVVTGHPICLILIFVGMNFWQGTSSIAEVSSVYKTLDEGTQSRWLGFKSMFGMLISTLTQIGITGLLSIGLTNNVILSLVIGIVVGSSIILPKVLDRTKYASEEISNPVDLNQIRCLLAAA